MNAIDVAGGVACAGEATARVTLPSIATEDWLASTDDARFGVSVVRRSSRVVVVDVNRAALQDMLDRATYYTFQSSDFDPEYRSLIRSCRAVIKRLRTFDWSVFDDTNHHQLEQQPRQQGV